MHRRVRRVLEIVLHERRGLRSGSQVPGGSSGAAARLGVLSSQLSQSLGCLELLQELRTRGTAAFGLPDISEPFPQHAHHAVVREGVTGGRLGHGTLLGIAEHQRLGQGRSLG